MSNQQLEDLYMPILRFLYASKSGFITEEMIIQKFVGARLKKTDIKSLLRALVQLQYVEKSDKDPQRIQLLDSDFSDVTPEQKVKGYKITEHGKYHFNTNSRTSSVSFGDNTNFAFNSPGAKQSIDITNYEKDVQIEINNMQEAVKNNDKSKLLKALGYILDKGVDVATAIALAYLGPSK